MYRKTACRATASLVRVLGAWALIIIHMKAELGRQRRGGGCGGAAAWHVGVVVQ